MSFQQAPLAFEPGLFGNRSKRASKGRWVDGNLVRFRDGVPAQMGGWVASPVSGVTIQGRARDMLAWRPNDQAARLCAIGTHTNAYLFDGGALSDITPTGFVAGRPDTIIGAGYGAGLYGRETYGTPRTTSANTLDAAVWTFDLFGQILLGCFSGSGEIYEFDPSADERLHLVAGAPIANAICVSDERHVFAFGCDGNPAYVRWGDRENRSIWEPSPSNRAGGYEMQVTSRFQCGKRARGQVLAWTMTELFGFTPLSNSLVYARDRLSSECGVMGPHAAVVVTDTSGDVAYWMSPQSFYLYDGYVRKLNCDLHDYVFKDINQTQRAKVQARANTMFGEVWFFYCSAASNEVDRAVVYSFETSTWTKADISRLVWMNAGIFPRPIAIDQSGTIFEHENGDRAGTDPMPSYILSHPLMVGTGQQFSDVSDFWPDMEPMSGTAALTIIGRDYAGAPDMVFGPYPFTPTVEKIDLAISTRQVQVKISGVEGPWELGLPILNVQSGGGR